MKIALAQINPTVGDIAGNCRRIASAIARAKELGAELAVFGELSVTGYPPRDLLSRPAFVAAAVSAVRELAQGCRGIAALVGYVRPTTRSPGRPLENVAALLSGGAIVDEHVKTLLPTYDVFDETRYFQPGPSPEPLLLEGQNLGVSICEDLWDRPALGRALYENDPIGHLHRSGSQVIINMSASPFQLGKVEVREDLVRRQALRTHLPIIYVNQVGGNDELIFDGGSLAVSGDGRVIGRCKSFAEDLLVIDTLGEPVRVEPVLPHIAQLAEALKLGLRDYLGKCGFKSVVLGLSGGIDSAVVATLAADALGPEHVLGLAMPSRYSSEHSLSDAHLLAKNLGVQCIDVGIEAMHQAFERALSPLLPKDAMDITDQNVQARIRGVVVMGFSNALGHMALATGNKSELATGYCTLYGDMNGGLGPIGDVPKTMVYQLARHLSGPSARIPEGSLTKPPSAELKPDQTDQDRLPPYDLLDAVLHRYIEKEQSIEEIVRDGFDAELVRKVVRMVTYSEYKRRQAPLVLKVTGRAFGSGRRIPIACVNFGL